MKSFSIGKALRFGWESIEKNFWLFLGLSVIIYALAYPLNMVVESDSWWLILISILLYFVLTTIVGIGMLRISLRLVDGQHVSFRDFSCSLPVFFRYIITSLLSAIIILLGMVLLIIPGIYFGIKYSFSLYFVIDRGLRPVAALKESSRITRGVKWRIFALGLLIGAIIIGITLLNIPLSGLVAFFGGETMLTIVQVVIGIITGLISLMAMLAYAFVYRKLLSEESPIQDG
ncbi:MAG: hypothetical protein ACYCX4_13155 [Bacillota bacterium]